MQVATWIVQAIALYTAIGALFAAWFVWKGIYRVDPQAHGSSIPFRFTILPGVVTLWPLLLGKAVGRSG